MTRDEALAKVRVNGCNLDDLPDCFKRDYRVVLTAIKNYSGSLEYADSSLKNCKKFIILAVKKAGLCLQYADDKLKDDKDVVLAAVKTFDDALRFASPSILCDINFIYNCFPEEFPSTFVNECVGFDMIGVPEFNKYNFDKIIYINKANFICLFEFFMKKVESNTYPLVRYLFILNVIVSQKELKMDGCSFDRFEEIFQKKELIISN